MPGRSLILSSLFISLWIAMAFSYNAQDGLMENDSNDDRTTFAQFKRRYNKSYSSAKEEEERFVIFRDNLRVAHELDGRHPSATFGVTKFMDLHRKEFVSQRLMKGNLNHLPGDVMSHHSEPMAFPKTFDWNMKPHVITTAKDQQDCGGDWAFSATETIESVWALRGHPLVSLSAQQIIDCDNASFGCNGGWPSSAYQYVINQGGLESEVAYPFDNDTDNLCAYDDSDVVATISGWKYVTPLNNGSEETMMSYVYQHSPISVCFDSETWRFYGGGVIKALHCGTDIDHCGQITGWSVVSGILAWNVRLSWGPDWGHNGYAWVEIGTNACSIANIVTVPII